MGGGHNFGRKHQNWLVNIFTGILLRNIIAFDCFFSRSLWCSHMGIRKVCKLTFLKQAINFQQSNGQFIFLCPIFLISKWYWKALFPEGQNPWESRLVLFCLFHLCNTIFTSSTIKINPFSAAEPLMASFPIQLQISLMIMILRRNTY